MREDECTFRLDSVLPDSYQHSFGDLRRALSETIFSTRQTRLLLADLVDIPGLVQNAIELRLHLWSFVPSRPPTRWE
jgi:hypothetical protein